MSKPIPFGTRSTADDVLAGLDLSRRTILVTGCNAGIGFETFRALAHHGAHVIGFDNLDGHRFYKPFTFYGQSKLACALFAKELSRRLAPRGIVANSLHPGAVGGTGLNRSLEFPLTAILSIARHFMKSVAQGASTQTLLAASPLVDGISGEYWVNCQIGKGSPFLNDRAMAERLWATSEAILASLLRGVHREDGKLMELAQRGQAANRGGPSRA
jgi:NAD(P)-dependent dehydrogenase (short-subunit alcohol dehydrogenase family)